MTLTDTVTSVREYGMSKSSKYNELLGMPMPTFLAQVISDRLRRKGTPVDPVIVDLILNMRDDTLKEEEQGKTTRFKQKEWSQALNREVEV